MTDRSRSPQVLLLLEEYSFGTVLATALLTDGYRVKLTLAPKDARKALRNAPPDVIVLDSSQSKTLLVNASAAGIPVMVLSGESSSEIRLEWLELGAADLMVKPVEIRELLLRIRTLARIVPKPSTMEPLHGPGQLNLAVDLTSRVVQHIDGSRTRLTETEFQLLKLFMNSPYEVLDRYRIGFELKYRTHDKGNRSIDVLVSKLRKKIDSPNSPSMINTVRNVGYVFMATRSVPAIGDRTPTSGSRGGGNHR